MRSIHGKKMQEQKSFSKESKINRIKRDGILWSPYKSGEYGKNVLEKNN